MAHFQGPHDNPVVREPERISTVVGPVAAESLLNRFPAGVERLAWAGRT